VPGEEEAVAVLVQGDGADDLGVGQRRRCRQRRRRGPRHRRAVDDVDGEDRLVGRPVHQQQAGPDVGARQVEQHLDPFGRPELDDVARGGCAEQPAVGGDLQQGAAVGAGQAEGAGVAAVDDAQPDGTGGDVQARPVGAVDQDDVADDGRVPRRVADEAAVVGEGAVGEDDDDVPLVVDGEAQVGLGGVLQQVGAGEPAVDPVGGPHQQVVVVPQRGGPLRVGVAGRAAGARGHLWATWPSCSAGACTPCRCSTAASSRPLWRVMARGWPGRATIVGPGTVPAKVSMGVGRPGRTSTSAARMGRSTAPPVSTRGRGSGVDQAGARRDGSVDARRNPVSSQVSGAR
jgi:hypothetical protein